MYTPEMNNRLSEQCNIISSIQCHLILPCNTLGYFFMSNWNVTGLVNNGKKDDGFFPKPSNYVRRINSFFSGNLLEIWSFWKISKIFANQINLIRVINTVHVTQMRWLQQCYKEFDEALTSTHQLYWLEDIHIHIIIIIFIWPVKVRQVASRNRY